MCIHTHTHTHTRSGDNRSVISTSPQYSTLIMLGALCKLSNIYILYAVLTTVIVLRAYE